MFYLAEAFPFTPMIARTWVGTTRSIDATKYLDYLKATGLEEYASTRVNRGTFVLTREGEERRSSS